MCNLLFRFSARQMPKSLKICIKTNFTHYDLRKYGEYFPIFFGISFFHIWFNNITRGLIQFVDIMILHTLLWRLKYRIAYFLRFLYSEIAESTVFFLVEERFHMCAIYIIYIIEISGISTSYVLKQSKYSLFTFLRFKILSFIN